VQSECFALLDIWELCTAYYVPNNAWSRKALLETRDALGMPAGLVHRDERPEYARALSAAGEGQRGKPALRPTALPPQFTSPLDREFRLVVAGSAGGKVRSTARTLGEAAILSGLWAAQQDDYPVTVQTGHSISELIFSPREILFTGISRPDALVLVTEDGRKAAARYLRGLTAESWLFTTPEFAGLDTPAQKVVVDPAALGAKGSKKNLGLLLSAAALRWLRLFPIEALEAAIRRSQRGDVVVENLAAVAASAPAPA